MLGSFQAFEKQFYSKVWQVIVLFNVKSKWLYILKHCTSINILYCFEEYLLEKGEQALHMVSTGTDQIYL